MFNNLLAYLVFLPSTVLCCFPMRGHLRHSLLRTTLTVGIVLTGTALVFAWLESAFNIDKTLLLFPLFIIYFTTYYCSLDVHISKALAVFCSSVALVSILTNFSICILDLTEGPPAVLQALNLLPIQFVLCVAAAALLAYPYHKYGKIIVDQAAETRMWYMTILISAAFFAINMFFLPLEEAMNGDRVLILHHIFILATLLLLWLAMQILFYFTISGTSSMYRTRERLRVLEMEKTQFAAQQRYMKASEKTRHDFRQSIRTLSELYESGDYDGLGEYLRQYIGRMPASEITSFCGNTALNALLNYYAHETAQNEIDFTLHVNIPEDIPVSDVDLCNMIGNILDNAMIACQKAKEKYIQLSVIAEDNLQLYIVAVNSFDGKIRQKDGKYLSTGRSGEGFGLSSILSTAEEYGGVAQFSHEGNRFYSNIAIPLD